MEACQTGGYPVDPHSQVDFKDPVQNFISVGALGFT